MSAVAFIRRCLHAGMTLEIALLAAEQFEAEINLDHLRGPALATGKSARNARAYQKRMAAKATEKRLNPPTESDLIQNPIKATEATESDLIQSPLACVVDNSLTTEIYPNTLSLSQIRDVAGDALASMATHPGVSTLAPLLGLLKADEPCSQSEVLDGIAKAAAWYRANRPPGSMTNWKLACTMALELRDARLTGIPKPKAPHERPDTPSAKRTAREDNLSRSFNAANAVSRGNRVFT